MKNIAIFTWYDDDRNCGQTLQAFALEEYIKNLYTLNVEIITYRNDVKKKIYKNDLVYPLHRWVKLNKNDKNKQKTFNLFIKENMKVSKALYTKKEINKYLKTNQITNLLVGSDQVWNPQKELDDVYFLNFTGDQYVKNAYAPSLMDPELTEYEYRLSNMKQYLENFLFLSTRESSGKNILLKYIKNKEIINVVDPVFLINQKKWHELSQKSKVKRTKNYILVYSLGSLNLCKILVELLLSSCNDIDVIYINTGENKEIPKEWINIYNVGPYEFLYLIANAKFICSDSFHGTVFSIIFEKNFYTVPSIRKAFKSNMQRVTDLLSALDLNDRYGETFSECLNDIDYFKVNNNLNIRIQESKDFLDKIMKSFGY